MKKLKITLITAIILSISLTACGKEKEVYDLSPQSIMDHAFDSTEDSFFKDWGLDKEAAQVDTSLSSTIYTLNESYEINKEKGQITVQFDEGKWGGITYQYIFSGTDSYLEDAYTFLYAYDKKLNEQYGEPQEQNGLTFLKANQTFEEFSNNIEGDTDDGLLGLICLDKGDIYELGDKIIFASTTADHENAMVNIKIFPSVKWDLKPLKRQ